jgi:membrane protein implicated in regulation of membrane protease activity
MPHFPVIWLALGVALLALEGLGAEFDGLLAAAVAALALSALSALVAVSPGLQVLLFAAGTGLLVLALQRWSLRRERAIPSSGAADEAVVISGFGGSCEAGRVRWQGQSWGATNLEPQRTLQPGQAVQVLGRDGNRLQVLAPPEA